MNDQLRKFLELEDLSPSQFADMMGIQRSSVSHILSERNKPSYDFIERMLTKFPQISAEWLILGKGKPYKEQNVPSAEKTETSAHLSLFSQPIENKDTIPQNEAPELSQKGLFDESPTPSQEYCNEIEVSEPQQFPQRISLDNQSSGESTTLPINEVKQSHKKQITRITVFYSDGTFEER